MLSDDRQILGYRVVVANSGVHLDSQSHCDIGTRHSLQVELWDLKYALRRCELLLVGVVVIVLKLIFFKEEYLHWRLFGCPIFQRLLRNLDSQLREMIVHLRLCLVVDDHDRILSEYRRVPDFKLLDLVLIVNLGSICEIPEIRQIERDCFSCLIVKLIFVVSFLF